MDLRCSMHVHFVFLGPAERGSSLIEDASIQGELI